MISTRQMSITRFNVQQACLAIVEGCYDNRTVDEDRKWYTVCGKFKSTDWMVNAAICIAGSFVSFISVLHLSRKTTSTNVGNPNHRKND